MTTNIDEVGGAYYISYSPGNATLYELFVTPTLGAGHYVVSWPEMNAAVILPCGIGSLDYGYVHEKINRNREHEISEVDASEIIKAIRKTPPFKNCSARLCTDLFGNWREPYNDPA